MTITERDSLQSLLADLIATWENEVVEFKQAGNDYPTDKIGSYFSALANEANLRGVERAWLIFVVLITKRVQWLDQVTGQRLSGCRAQRCRLRKAQSITFRNIHQMNMIDTMGYGIHDMHTGQARRYFPMPDYDLDDPEAVKMTVYGSVVDPAYSRLLIQKIDLPLDEILALDRVQKRLPLADDMIKRLRRDGLIEGRKPNLHVSASVAKVTSSKVDYIRTRAQDDDYYAKLISDYLSKFGEASREEINKLLLPKLSDSLSDDQKTTKINNLLTKWRRAELIRNLGSDRASRWSLAEKTAENKK